MKITLVDRSGRELLMPTDFDEFSSRASRTYGGIPEDTRKKLSISLK